MTRCRTMTADVLERIGSWCCMTASRVRPPYTGPMCPDCNLVADPGPDEPCWMCEQLGETQQREAEIAGGAFDDGYLTGRRDADRDCA